MADDSLFLLEVLVDKVTFTKSPCFSDKEFKTCVSITCQSVAPLEICDDDPGACLSKSGGPFVKNFNNGKSCLFSLKESEIAAAMTKFPIHVVVYKFLPCGCIPTKITLGEATIDMTKEFIQARNKYKEDPNSVSYQALKDTFRIMGSDGQDSGEISMFLRISCFGKLIVTRFQGSAFPPTLGAGMRSTNINDRPCNPPREFQTPDAPCVCGASRAGGGGGGAGSMGAMPCAAAGAGLCPTNRDPFNSMPCIDDDPCYCSGPRRQQQTPLACRNTDPYCLHIPKGNPPSLPINQELSEDLQENENTTAKQLPLSEEFLAFYSELSKWSDSEDTIERVENKQFTGELFASVKETNVYMTLYDPYSISQNSGTQATAAVNKSLQVQNPLIKLRSLSDIPDLGSSSNPSSNTINDSLSKLDKSSARRFQQVFFFDRKKGCLGAGIGKSCAKNKPDPDQSNKDTPAAEPSCRPCQDFTATISHIKIGPRPPCQPCDGGGMKCVVANPQNEAPVRVSTVSNPRRGVFELVVRRLNGAPLAKNELMLEWTPPSSKAPCSMSCFPIGPCRPGRCRMVSRLPSCSKRPCRRSCGQPPCNLPCGLSTCNRCCRSLCPIRKRRKPKCFPKFCAPLFCFPKNCPPLSCPPRQCQTLPCLPRYCPPLSCAPKYCPPLPCVPKYCPPLSCVPTYCSTFSCLPKYCPPSSSLPKYRISPPTPCFVSCTSSCVPLPYRPICRPSCLPRPCRPKCRPLCPPLPCRSKCRPSCLPLPCRPICKPSCLPLPCRTKCRPSCLPLPCRTKCRPSCLPRPCRPKCRPLCPPRSCRPKCRPLCSPQPCNSPCSPPPCRPKFPPPPCRELCKPLCPPILPPACFPDPCKPKCRPCSSLPCPRKCRTCPPPRCRPCSPPTRCRPKPICILPCSSALRKRSPTRVCRSCVPRCNPCPAPFQPCPPTPDCPSPCSRCSDSPCPVQPCFKPCPVGRPRKCRKIRCQPKIRAHRKIISPCLNRGPLTGCRTVPGCLVCGGCCALDHCCASGCGPDPYCCPKFPFKQRCLSTKC